MRSSSPCGPWPSRSSIMGPNPYASMPLARSCAMSVAPELIEGGVMQLVLREVFLNRRRGGRIGDMVVSPGGLGRADSRQPLEIGARRVVEAHRRLPRPEPGHGLRQPEHGIIGRRPGAVASFSV